MVSEEIKQLQEQNRKNYFRRIQYLFKELKKHDHLKGLGVESDSHESVSLAIRQSFFGLEGDQRWLKDTLKGFGKPSYDQLKNTIIPKLKEHLHDAYLVHHVTSYLLGQGEIDSLNLQPTLNKSIIEEKQLGISWIITLLPNDERYRDINMGIDFFQEQVKQKKNIKEVLPEIAKKYADGDVITKETLSSNFRKAIALRHIKVTSVERDDKLEKQIFNIYKNISNKRAEWKKAEIPLRKIYVAKLPKNNENNSTYIDALVIRTEIVATLAGQILSDQQLNSGVGLAYGYTLERVCNNMSYSASNDSLHWVPMQTFPLNEAFVESRNSNSLAVLFANRFPESKAMYLPFLEKHERNDMSKPNKKVIWQVENSREVFKALDKADRFIVSAAGFDDDSSTEHPLSPSDGKKYSFELLDKLCEKAMDSDESEELAGVFLGRITRKDGYFINNEELKEENGKISFSYSPIKLRERLRDNKECWLIASGDHKKQIVKTLVDNQFCSHLVIDSRIAEFLVNEYEDMIDPEFL